MNIFILLVFLVVSVSANLEKPEDTRYFIKNAKTNKYLFVDDPYTPLNGKSVARNVCTLDIANQVPNSTPNSLFILVSNNAIGPYYNIINFGTNSVLFASEIVVGTENNVTVTKVLAGKDTDYLIKPEALWNIRHFKNDLYILNVHYGAYLYTNDNEKSSAILDRNRRVAMLMPNEGGGRVLGTQWLIISNAKPRETIPRREEVGDFFGGEMSVIAKEKVEDGEMVQENENGGEQGIREQIVAGTGLKEIKQLAEQQTVVGSGATNTRQGGLGQKSVATDRETTFKAWVMLFDCHITTTKPDITTTWKPYWDPSWYTPIDRAGYPCAELRRFMSA